MTCIHGKPGTSKDGQVFVVVPYLGIEPFYLPGGARVGPGDAIVYDENFVLYRVYPMSELESNDFVVELPSS